MTYFEFLGEHGPTLLMGATTTVKVLVFSTILYVIISMIFGLMRISKNPIIQGIATVYIEIFRGTSLLVQLFWFYYVIPFFGISLEAFVAGVLSLGMNFSSTKRTMGGCSRFKLWSSKKNKKNNYSTDFPDCTATSCKSYSGTIKSYFISSLSYCC